MRRAESGQVSIFVLGVALVCFAVAGIAVDGTRAFLYRRTLQNAADAAAVAGASEIDAGAYYSSRKDVVLERSRAGSSAMHWLAERGLAVEADVSATEEIVRVALRGRIRTTFLGLLGITDLPVAADAAAEPVPRDP